MQLFDRDGSRKYLTVAERARFLRAAEQAPREARTLCMTLAWSGCRLSEAIALTADRVDLAGGVLVFATLKKRQDGIYRAVPVPPSLLEALDLVHGIREAQRRRGRGSAARLWPWSRMTGWRAVHAVMDAAGLSGPAASPRACAMPSALPPSPAAFPQHGAEMARSRPALHHRHLRRCRRRRGTRISHGKCGGNAFCEDEIGLHRYI
ncbi:tyrosine-type recombinase/integrase [Komagataeibacter rhaeticus]|nr:tyrosine-type recombinase/integrase [Komagataeibacter rhaeticus]